MAMTETNYPLSGAGDTDDLPRTLRRERERQKAAAAGGSPSGLSAAAQSYAPRDVVSADDLVPASVQRFDVSFFRLVGFFLKAVIAAIPALILLGAILWGAGVALKHFFPWLIQAEFIIRLPR